VQTARSLAIELAKRTRFLRDEVISVEMEENGSKGHKQIIGFYGAFKKYLIGTLTENNLLISTRKPLPTVYLLPEQEQTVSLTVSLPLITSPIP